MSTPRIIQPPHVRRLPHGAVLLCTALAMAIMLGGPYHELSETLSLAPLPIGFPLTLIAWDVLRAAGCGLVLIIIWTAGQPVREYLGFVKWEWREPWAGQIGLLASIAIIAFTLSSLWFYGVAPTSGAASYIEAIAGRNWAWLTGSVLLGRMVVAPLADEIVFRGFLYRTLAESPLGSGGAIAATAAAFGLSYKIGGAGWDWVIVMTSVGIMFGWLRWFRGNITAPIMAHAYLNFVIGLVIFVVAASESLQIDLDSTGMNR